MVDREVLQFRISKIREYVGLLKRLARTEQERFVRDALIHGSAERYLQLSIQCVLDISNHVVADMKLAVPSEYRQVFDILAEQRILSKRLAGRLASMAGLRNILVHDYMEIDRRQVHRILRNHLGDFEKFVRAMAKLL